MSGSETGPLAAGSWQLAVVAAAAAMAEFEFEFEFEYGFALGFFCCSSCA